MNLYSHCSEKETLKQKTKGKIQNNEPIERSWGYKEFMHLLTSFFLSPLSSHLMKSIWIDMNKTRVRLIHADFTQKSDSVHHKKISIWKIHSKIHVKEII